MEHRIQMIYAMVSQRHLAEDADMESLIIDSAIMRAHQCAAGASHKKGGSPPKPLDALRGGFSAKVHVNVDALGNPMRFRLSAGHRHDITEAEALIPGYSSKYVIADKGI